MRKLGRGALELVFVKSAPHREICVGVGDLAVEQVA